MARKSKPAPAPAAKVKQAKQPPQAGRKSPRTTRTKPAKKGAKKVSLGRPRAVGEETLDMVFKEDFPARQIFVFLGVATLKQLEEFGPDEILEKLVQPMHETIDRIRRRLAMLNRSLAGDQRYAVDFLQKLKDEQAQSRGS